MTEAQIKTSMQKTICKISQVQFILDDESYFTLPKTDQLGIDIYYSNNKEKTPLGQF